MISEVEKEKEKRRKKKHPKKRIVNRKKANYRSACHGQDTLHQLKS